MGKPDPESPSDPLRVDAYITEKFQGDGRAHSPATMRAIARALSKSLEAMEKPGIGGTAMADVQLAATQFGEWTDAKAFGATAGEASAGKKLGQVYTEFVEAYRSVIAAVEASAGNHAEAARRNEGA